MAITFAVRGDSLDARYSSSGATPGIMGTNGPPGVTTDTVGINGVNSIDMVGSFLTFRSLNYTGILSTPSGKARSVLTRVNFASLSSTMGLFGMGGMVRSQINYLGLSINNTPEIISTVGNEVGQTDSGTTAASGITTGAFFDIVVTWDGTLGVGSLIVYVNGVAKLTDTTTRDLPTYDTNQQRCCHNIVIGSDYSNQNVHYSVDEFVVWDTVIDPTSVTLTSGSGSLNGASRTAYVDVDAFDGAASTGGVTRKTL